MSDTQNIDDKKNNNIGSTIKNNATEIVKFAITTIILVTIVVFYFSLSSKLKQWHKYVIFLINHYDF
jgi:heme/copper-type cytochrome/quinol oxidase subunit 2